MRFFVTVTFSFILTLVVVGCRTSPSSHVNVSDQKSSDLVKWLSSSNAPKNLRRDHPALPYEICDELLSRHEVDFLLISLDHVADEGSRTLLVSRVLYAIDDLRIFKAFASRLNDEESEESYFIANYLAKKGNPAALAVLNRHYYKYPVSSWQWSYTVELFGKYKYRSATTNLVDSLDAASLNLSSAACEALHELFPDSPAPGDFKGPSEAETYYQNRLSQFKENN